MRGGFGATQESGSDGDRAGSQCERSSNTTSIPDAARRNDRNIDVIGQSRNEGKEAYRLALRRCGIEGAAMAARLEPLGHDCIGTSGLRLTRLCERRGRREPCDALVFEPSHERVRIQPHDR